MSQSESQPNGFWIPIRDRESALHAVRMSGLPVFLAGLFQLLIAAFGASAADGERIVFLVLGAALVASGLAIRRGIAALVPLSAGFVMVGLLAGFATTAFGLALSFRFEEAYAAALMSVGWHSILPLLILLMMISGLRGWWWLRRDRLSERS